MGCSEVKVSMAGGRPHAHRHTSRSRAHLTVWIAPMSDPLAHMRVPDCLSNTEPRAGSKPIWIVWPALRSTSALTRKVT